MDPLWIAGLVGVLVVVVVLSILVSNFSNTMFGSKEDWYDMDFSDDD